MMQVSTYNGGQKLSGDGTLYYVEGHIFDAETKQPINGVSITIVVDATNQVLTKPFIVTENFYSSWTDENPYQESVLFQKKGYKAKKVLISKLFFDDPDVYLEKGSAFPAWQIAVVLGAVYFISKKKKKAVGAFSIDNVLPILLLVGGIIAFDIIKDILEWVGLWKSRASKDLDNAATDPNSAWNPNFYKQKPPNAPWTYAITTSQAKQYASQIYNSFGAFNDCEECAIGVFKSQRTKSNVSFIADIFQQQYGEDLLKFLRGGWWPQDRLSDDDVHEINKYIENLPNW